MITLQKLKITAKKLIKQVYNVKFATITQIKKLFPGKKLNEAYSWYEIIKICNEKLTEKSTKKNTTNIGYTINPLEYQEYQVINNFTKASYTVNLLADNFKERCNCMSANYNKECKHQKMVSEFVKQSLENQIKNVREIEQTDEELDRIREIQNLKTLKLEMGKQLELALIKFNCSFSEFDYFSSRVSTKVFYNKTKMGDVWYDTDKNQWMYAPNNIVTLKASCASDAVEMLLVRKGVNLGEALGVF